MSCPTGPTSSSPTSRSSRSRRCCRALLAAAAAALGLPRAREAAVRGRARAGGQGRRRALARTTGAPRSSTVGEWAAARGHAVLGYASSGLPGPAGNRESFVWLAEGGRAGRGRVDRGRRAARWSREAAGAHHALHAPVPASRRATASSACSMPRASGASRCWCRPPRRRSTHRGAGGRPARRGGQRAHRPRAGARRRRQHPHRAARVRGPRRARLRRSTSARSASSRRWSRTGSTRRSPSRSTGASSCSSCPGIAAVGRRRRALGRERRVRSPPSSPAASPSSATRSRTTRSARCAATGSWPPRRSGRPATTSPTAARSWPGAWRATSCRSSRRTR